MSRSLLLPLTLACALASLSACDTRVVEDSGEAPVVEVAEPESPCVPVVFEEAHFTHCTADPAIHLIRMVESNADGVPFRSFANYAGARSADAAPVAFAVNGGMFDEDGHAIGYYVEEGERLKRLNRAEGPGNFHMLPNGVFFGSAGAEWRVWDTQRFFDNVTSRPDFGTQSGPMLVLAGELHPDIVPDGDSLRIRNGVGVDPAGRAHFVISDEPVSFGRLARYYRDVIGTANALFLDGNVSQLWDPARSRMDNRAPIGPMIVVEMRENAE